MLNIYTYIISCIVFSDLVPDIYFHDTNTGDSCDMHYFDYMTFLDLPCYFILWSRVLVIILQNSYSSRTSNVHYIYATPCMHGLLVHDLSSQFSCYYYYFQFSILLIILFLLFQCPTRAVTAFSYSFFTILFPPCTLAGPLLTDFIIFQYLDQKAGIESWS